MNTEKIELKGLFPEELAQHVSDMGLERYRTRQLIDWLYNKGVTDFESMTNLSKTVRARFDERFTLLKLNRVGELRSLSKDTVKFLFELPDNRLIEKCFDVGWQASNAVCVVAGGVSARLPVLCDCAHGVDSQFDGGRDC